MGQSYSSTKPINRLYFYYLRVERTNIHEINDSEWIEDLRDNVRKAIQKISSDYVTNHLMQQLNKSDPLSTEPLITYYMKKIIIAITANSYINEIRNIEDSSSHPDIERYEDVLNLIFNMVHTVRRYRSGRQLKKVIYQDRFMYETVLDKIREKYFTPHEIPNTRPKRSASYIEKSKKEKVKQNTREEFTNSDIVDTST
jgi:hypothetical protein